MISEVQQAILREHNRVQVALFFEEREDIATLVEDAYEEASLELADFLDDVQFAFGRLAAAIKERDHEWICDCLDEIQMMMTT